VDVLDIWNDRRHRSTSKTSSTSSQDRGWDGTNSRVSIDERYIKSLSSALDYSCWRHWLQLPGRFRRLPSRVGGN